MEEDGWWADGGGGWIVTDYILFLFLFLFQRGR